MRALPSPLRSPTPRPCAEDGFSLIEVMIAALVLTVAILGLAGAFSSARKLTLLSERRTAMAYRVQLEIERLQGYSYSELAMASAPAHSSEKSSPDYYITEGVEPTYQYGTSAGETEALVVNKVTGVAAATPSGRQCAEKVGA
ncbi:MAG TPA: prepilin-type N-terminal cleavage/methylation domain-containing protein, partial [Solirubrobacteraceae bacterium]|nr:prepilin-type N-terminal cleavage/methylation domain-containing protein [Solirubrobacteraceae bacterium]